MRGLLDGLGGAFYNGWGSSATQKEGRDRLAGACFKGRPTSGFPAVPSARTK